MNEYVGDISAFFGQQDVVLRFEVVPTGNPSHGMADIDAIQFSPTQVPEPSMFAILAAGVAAAFGFVLRRQAVGDRR